MKKNVGIKTCSKPMVMAISLDQRKKTERIIIGQMDVVERWLAGTGELSALYDVVRPLGTFLIEHEAQNKEEWAQCAGGLLVEAVSTFAHRKDKETAAWNYLEKKLGANDMVCEFTARQSWYWYQTCCTALGSNEKSREFSEQFLYLTRSLNQTMWRKDGECSVEAAWDVVQRALNGRIRNSMEQRMIVRYAARNRDEEWLMITESYYPALQYYLKKLIDWKLCVCRCSVCNTIFIADSGHYSLCSADCRKIQNRRNKQKFDAKAKENGYDQAYKNTCQRMRNRLMKLKGHEVYPEAEAWFQSFRNGATGRKKRITNTDESRAFEDWMFAQERAFDQICSL